MLCKKCTKKDVEEEEYKGEHLVYAKMVEESDDWEGSIKATRDLIKESEVRVKTEIKADIKADIKAENKESEDRIMA